MMLPLTLQVEIQGKFKPENKSTLTGAETWTVKEKKKKPVLKDIHSASLHFRTFS